jgi:uncharacterized protein YjbI with pentapeptide repeats
MPDIGGTSSDMSIPAGFDTWNAYWKAQGMPWRTEPEIDVEQQRFLAERRVVKPDLEKGIYAFRDESGGIKLTRADVEWLLATHESGGVSGPVYASDTHERAGIDLRGADLRNVELRGLPMARMRGSLGPSEWRQVGPKERMWAAVQLNGADLRQAHLEGAVLMWACLVGADMYQGHLEGVFFSNSRLEQADLRGAHLEQAQLYAAHLEGVNLRDAHLEGADLHGAFVDSQTQLHRAALSSAACGSVTVADVSWDGANLAVLSWRAAQPLGDEVQARVVKGADGARKHKSTRILEFETAVRANRQLATAMRRQGMNEDADNFAYRAQLLQRQVLVRQGRLGTSFFSWVLDVISGYGYKPLRSVITYLLVILSFASAYFALTNFALTPFLPSHSSPLAWYEAIVLSISSFHGRGLFPSGLSLGDPVAILAALEAIIGLLIEITFIATFTQRFFAR